MSDLKITQAGVVQSQDRNGPINPVAPLGQAGSVYTEAGNEEINPPLNQAFVAITMITDCTFDSSAGLQSENDDKFINSQNASHNQAAGAETSEVGSGGMVTDGVVFPAGLTIYGRWIEIDVSAGSCIAYIG